MNTQGSVAGALFAEHGARLYRLAGKMDSAQVSMDHDDLVQVGWLGLVEAHQRYDVSKNPLFWPYAYKRVRGAMADATRDARYFSRGAGWGYTIEHYVPELDERPIALEDDRLSRWPALMADLPGREAQILTLYAIRGLALHRIGKLYDITESRVAQIVTAALKKLRSKMQ